MLPSSWERKRGREVVPAQTIGLPVGNAWV